MSRRVLIYKDLSDVPLFAYDFIMADPPWNFRTYSSKGNTKGAAAKYRCMATHEIAKMQVNQIAAKDAVLWLWATHPMLPAALHVMEEWGFRFVTSGTWGKYNRKTDKIHFGTGYRLRSASEPFLIGLCGKPKTSKSIRTLLLAPYTGKHSQKPDLAFAEAERMMPSAMRRIELFSRNERPGWDVMGDEL